VRRIAAFLSALVLQDFPATAAAGCAGADASPRFGARLKRFVEYLPGSLHRKTAGAGSLSGAERADLQRVFDALFDRIDFSAAAGALVESMPGGPARPGAPGGKGGWLRLRAALAEIEAPVLCR
jgi:hypothetical protein